MYESPLLVLIRRQPAVQKSTTMLFQSKSLPCVTVITFIPFLMMHYINFHQANQLELYVTLDFFEIYYKDMP